MLLNLLLKIKKTVLKSVIAKLKNFLKNDLLSKFKSKFIKVKKRLKRKDYSNSTNDPEKILLIDKKTADLFNEDTYLELNPDVKKLV